MPIVRQQVDLSIKRPIYVSAMQKMHALQHEERMTQGVMKTTLADIGREAILLYKAGDGAKYAPRILRSPKGQKPARSPFRFEVPSEKYAYQKNLIMSEGYRVTQVVEEALKRFVDTGKLPWE